MKVAVLVFLWLSALSSSALEEETTLVWGLGRRPVIQPEAGWGVILTVIKNLGVVGIVAGFDLLSTLLSIGYRHIK